MHQQFDRSAEDLGNSIHLEHVNVTVPDQRLASLFYVTGLGLTRDPYLMVSDTNMWVNVGQEPVSFAERKRAGAARSYRPRHRGPRGAARPAGIGRQEARGHGVRIREHNDHVEATCPWGNRVRCYEPDAARFGRITLGIPYVEFDVPVGSAQGICAFYPEIMGMPAELQERRRHRRVREDRTEPAIVVPRDRSAAGRI